MRQNETRRAVSRLWDRLKTEKDIIEYMTRNGFKVEKYGYHYIITKERFVHCFSTLFDCLGFCYGWLHSERKEQREKNKNVVPF